MRSKNIAKRTALAGVLCAQALALSFFEGLIPFSAGLPPGAKPGLSNVVVMFCAASAGIPETFAVVIIKSLFAGITRGFSAFIMSISGGLLSCAAAILLLRITENKLGYIGVGIICAVCHNTGQLCAATVISSTPELFTGYGPFLLLASLLTGLLTGTILKYVMPALMKQTEYIMKTKTDKGLNK